MAIVEPPPAAKMRMATTIPAARAAEAAILIDLLLIIVLHVRHLLCPVVAVCVFLDSSNATSWWYFFFQLAASNWAFSEPTARRIVASSHLSFCSGFMTVSDSADVRRMFSRIAWYAGVSRVPPVAWYPAIPQSLHNSTRYDTSGTAAREHQLADA